MEIGREAKREIGEYGPGSSRVDVFGLWARREPPEEADGYGGHEAEEESEHRHRDADRCGHGFHLQAHDYGSLGSASVGLFWVSGFISP